MLLEIQRKTIDWDVNVNVGIVRREVIRKKMEEGPEENSDRSAAVDAMGNFEEAVDTLVDLGVLTYCWILCRKRGLSM